MTQRAWSEETSADTAKELNLEVNSLRRFLAGLTATTFGVLVALHPNEFSSQCSGIVYAISVVANAISVLAFIGSLFGRFWNLIEKGVNQKNESIADFQGKEYNGIKMKFPHRFKIYSLIGLGSYVIAIISSCVYIVLEVCLN